MDHEEFGRLVARRFGLASDVLAGKAMEYASGIDRFHNFNVAGAAKGETPEQALWGMFMKHFVSVQDMVQSGKRPNQAWIDEKLSDMINYLLLLEGLFSAEDNKTGVTVDDTDETYTVLRDDGSTPSQEVIAALRKDVEMRMGARGD